MEFIKGRFLARVDNFLQNLGNVAFMVNGELSTLELDDIVDYVSLALTRYVVSICDDTDLSKRPASEFVEHSVECQRLVEQDCNEVYASRLAQAFRNLMTSKLSLHSFDKLVDGDLFSRSGSSSSPSSQDWSHSNAPGSLGYRDSGNICPQGHGYFPGESSNGIEFKELFDNVGVRADGFFSSLDSDLMVYSTTDVSDLLKIRPCRLVLEFISDSPFDYGNITAPKKGNRKGCPNSRGNFVGINCETHANSILNRFSFLCLSVSPLRSQAHADYLKGYLSAEGDPKTINLGYLDCSRPWIVYWALHSLSLLGEDVRVYRQRTINTLNECWDPELGGFGGGPAQRGHVATTYAALCVLRMLGALDEVDAHKLHAFLSDMRTESGAFRSTYGGEHDTRSTYCAVASAHMVGLLDEELARGTAEFVAGCQTYEGGLAAEPDLEAHAGYTYCGLACLALLGRLELLELEPLHDWLLGRVTSQFGFQGRPHKLVDVCYSFWIGASIRIVEDRLGVEGVEGLGVERQLVGGGCAQGEARMFEKLLRCYILAVSQTARGFRDKPNKPPDLYHTCYALSYLNILGPIVERRHDILLNVLEFYSILQVHRALAV